MPALKPLGVISVTVMVSVPRVYVFTLCCAHPENGMDAMRDAPEEGRRLVVHSERDGDGLVRISVSDRGHGIPADRLVRVFDSFYTTKEHGMGLGLAIARSIVELHGGHIWAENDSAGGATLRFTLPTVSAAAAERG